ncbi:hypothetical protein P4H27_08080 [Paenibacillus taichungensis]|uniref:hypothetical protein n=1 Tax=Paenibacillus taichungensis TaxID=484184 RepID=UPI002DB56C7C|nr:hypothetical protein [Paenibacillus taichungensis]MEC0106894.1 hypothetical protein [Paenibacillus taichungensis]MEC0195176.1 hypothetical protein [Paenibacillus taichungensis]
MNTWIPLTIVASVIFIGFIKSYMDYNSKSNQNEFAIEFLNNYREFCNELFKNNFDEEKYQWLKLNSSKMQSSMGRYGIAASYKPGGANYFSKNYQVIVNSLPEIRNQYRRMINGFGLSFEWRMLEETVRMIEEVLLTYIGAQSNIVEDAKKELRNPLIWLREGVRFIVTSPISLFYWSGLMQYSTYNTISNNFFVKLISFLIGLIGLISSIVTIVTGYTPFKNIIGF